MVTGFGALSVEITADATNFTAALKNAEGQLGSTQAKMNRALAALEKGWKSVSAGLKNVLGPVFSLKGALGLLAGGVGVAGLAALTKNAIDAADAIIDMADRIGISTDALQELMYVASMSGLSVENLETGLRKLNSTIADQAAGKKTVLGQLGIDAKDAAGNVRPLTDVMLDLADAFQKAGPQSAAGIRILTQALGERAGTAFAAALRDGSAGVRQMIGDARQLGLVLENNLLRGAASANDALDRMKMIVGTNLNRVLLQLAPLAERLAQVFADGAPHIERWANALTSFLFGVEALGTKGLKQEIESINQEIAALDKRIADRTRIHQKIPSQELEQRAELVKRLLQAEQLLEDQQRRDEATSRMPPSGRVPTGMVERGADKNKMAEFLDGLRQAAQLAGEEGEARAVLEAVLRAEAIAREQVAAGQRASAELTAKERDDIERYVRLQQEAVQIETERKKRQEEGKQLYEQTRTPAEQYAATLERLNQLLAENAISEDTANRARAQAKEAFERADEGAQQAKQASDQLAMSFKSAFEEAVAGGKKIDDILAALIQDIIKMIVQLYILKPLMNSIASQFNQILGGGGNWLGSLFGSSSSIFTSSAGGTDWIDGYLGFANGGSFQVGGAGGTDSQLVAFRASPGELVDVRTPGQAARGGGGNVIVQVNNKTDGRASAREEQGPDGEHMIVVTVEKELRRPGSSLHRALRQTFTVNQKLTKRG